MATTRDDLIKMLDAASSIMDRLEYTQADDYEPDLELGFNDPAYLYNMCKRTYDSVDYWLNNVVRN